MQAATAHKPSCLTSSLIERSLRDLTRDLHQRSLCRWTYETDTDETRQPMELAQVTRCDLAEHLNGSNSYGCEFVKAYVPVKRLRDSGDGKKVWTDDWEPLRVGCTLASPAQRQTRLGP